MECHYEFVPGDEIIIDPGRTLKRIRSLVAIEVIGVSVGDVGGYVEKIDNLSDNAWVYGNADYLLIGPAKSSGRFTTAHKDQKLGVRINCGCFSGTVAEFSKQIESTHKGNKEHLEQYRLFCQLIAFNFNVTE